MGGSVAARREVGHLVVAAPSADDLLGRPRLRADACHDEVYLDLTEDGRYLVIVETATARPVFMYWQQYRP